jgi:uncharacterized tellurite resistance protein B-like protein
MGLRDLFKKRDQRVLHDHLKNVVALAQADGRLDAGEMAIIQKVALAAGVSEDELQDILDDPAELKIAAAASQTQRIEQFYDLILTMLVDGQIDKEESKLCFDVAAILGFEESMVQTLIGDVIESIRSELDPAEVIAQMRKHVGEG